MWDKINRNCKIRKVEELTVLEVQGTRISEQEKVKQKIEKHLGCLRKDRGIKRSEVKY